MSKEQGSESAVSRSQFIKEEQMAEEKEAPRKLTRKDFVKGAAAVAGVGALAGCAPAAPTTGPEAAPTCPPAAECPTPWLPDKWDKEADVVVVGFGGAGAAAAITAHDAGAKVLILEKQPDDTPTEVRHTCSTRHSSGNATLWVGSEDDAVKYLRWATLGMVPDDVIEAYVAKWVDLDQWVESIGGRPVITPGEGPGEFPVDAPGYDGGNNKSSLRYAEADSGPVAWELFKENIDSRGIEVLFETPAKRLITDCTTGGVIGVEATTGGLPVYVKAKKAVVLASGGFAQNEQMKTEANKGARFESYATSAATGDGIALAVGAGADLWHMSCAAGRVGVTRFAGTPVGTSISFTGREWAAMVVDQYGKRFADEGAINEGHSSWAAACHWDEHRLEYPRLPCWAIFDETAKLNGSVARLKDGGAVIRLRTKGRLPDGTFQYWFDWSEDDSAEIAKGWILKGDTIEELAANIQADAENKSPLHPEGRMDPATLKETLTKYNQYCAAGEDPDFGRDEKGLFPLPTPPYYAIKAYPGGPNTFGGPRKNGKGQVLYVDGTPIDRLYCAGELGSINTVSYPMNNYGEITITGRIAGENAAAEEPWA